MERSYATESQSEKFLSKHISDLQIIFFENNKMVHETISIH